ncbi:MAG TPA: hypothetical protein DCZ97_16320 [Syntrophus sp. (in: bacteria)]|nr:hypothetical protein [Syntrophus sp. (in: bacteria)]
MDIQPAGDQPVVERDGAGGRFFLGDIGDKPNFFYKHPSTLQAIWQTVYHKMPPVSNGFNGDGFVKGPQARRASPEE